MPKMTRYLVDHRDGKHGHATPYCSHPDCIAATAQAMLKNRARVKKEKAEALKIEVERLAKITHRKGSHG